MKISLGPVVQSIKFFLPVNFTNNLVLLEKSYLKDKSRTLYTTYLLKKDETVKARIDLLYQIYLWYYGQHLSLDI